MFAYVIGKSMLIQPRAFNPCQAIKQVLFDTNNQPTS